MKRCNCTFGLAALMTAAVLFSGVSYAVPQRNILLFIADDIGIDSLALYNDDAGATFPPTPTLDVLADRGILFANAYAYPTCSPTRSAMMTGRYAYRTGVFSPQTNWNFHPDEYTLPDYFADNPQLGYRLASVGKWHLGSDNSAPNVTGGWPHFAGSLGGGLRNYRRFPKVEDGVSSTITGTYVPRENVDDAIAWINEQGTNKWFMWVAFNSAHTPLHKPPNPMHSYDYLSGDATDIDANPRPYFEAMIEAMDYQMDRLIDNIDTNATTIIFIGDNGTASGTIQPPYNISQRAKGSVYEGGTHVPMIIAGPDVVSGGRTNDAVVHCADLFATVIELAGGTVPATGADSRSLVPIIENTAFTPAEDCILVESDDVTGPGGAGRAIRNAQYKLIRIDGQGDRFFDMIADPLEGTNLVGSMTAPEQAAFDALDAKLDAWTNTAPAAADSGYPVVDTGQISCYDDQGGYTIAHPASGQAFHGQDGQYAGLQPHYLDNGDGTITDVKTGLMWQQTPDLVNKSTWTNAVTNAVNQTTGGYADWRLPTIKELYSLINFTGETGTNEATATPYIDTDYFDFVYGDTNVERYIDAQYWSSTEYVHYTMGGDETVFGVNFADGRIKGYPKVQPGGGGGEHTAFVRYVRGNTQYGINDFVDNGDGTVTDHATGLMWQQGDSGAVTQNWEQALAYAEGLELAGYRDWRLPNAKELQSIVDYTRSPMTSGTAAIDTNFFDVTETESFYWTSTTHLDGALDSLGNYAVYVCFGRALGWMEQPPGSGNWQLLDVHGAGAQRSDPKDGNPADYPHGHGPQGDVIRIFNYVRCVRGGVEESIVYDTDFDGLSDAYEYEYTGNITNMAAAGDNDNDGFINIDEKGAGTIPTDGTSFLALTDIEESSPTGTVIRWSSELDQSYTIESSTNLMTDTFSTEVASGIPATPPENTYTNETADPKGSLFFRVKAE